MSLLCTALAAVVLVAGPDPSGTTADASSVSSRQEASTAQEDPVPPRATSLQEGTETPDDLGPLVTDRPDATESAETVGRGRFQLEGGYTGSRLEGVDSHAFGEFLLRIGVIHENVEFRLAMNPYALVQGRGESASGIQNVNLGAKFRLVSGGGAGHARPAVAILAAASIPTGSTEVDDATVIPEARIAAAWDLSEAFSVGTNVIWALPVDEVLDERFATWGFSLALGYGISERWGAYFEYFGAYPAGERDAENYLNTGLTYLINNDLQLDARVGHGLNGSDDDYFFGIGGAVRW